MAHLALEGAALGVVVLAIALEAVAHGLVEEHTGGLGARSAGPVYGSTTGALRSATSSVITSSTIFCSLASSGRPSSTGAYTSRPSSRSSPSVARATASTWMPKTVLTVDTRVPSLDTK